MRNEDRATEIPAQNSYAWETERLSKSGDLAHRIDDSFNSRKAGSILLCKPEIDRKAGEEAKERSRQDTR